MAALVGTRGGGSALVKGVAGGAAVLAASGTGNALAQGETEFTLTASEVDWDVGGGRLVKASAYNGTVPGPTLRVAARTPFSITVNNRLLVPTTLHLHGCHTCDNFYDGVALL